MKLPISIMIVLTLLITFSLARRMKENCINAETRKMVDELKSKGLVTNSIVEQVMCAVDRKDFTDQDAYSMEPQLIGFGSTISGPPHQAHALEELAKILTNNKKSKRILDIGSGSGIMLAYFAQMLSITDCLQCTVYGIEHIPNLVPKAYNNLSKHHGNFLNRNKNKNKILIMNKLRDGRKGYAKSKPYDYIHVGAAFMDKRPDAIISQLQKGGRLYIPVKNEGEDAETITLFDKEKNGKIKETKMEKTHYVPLQSTKKQLSLIGKNEYYDE